MMSIQGIQGQLNEFDLPSILQLLCMGQRRSVVRLERRGEDGAIFIDQGQIVHAAFGCLAGEEAFYRLLPWREGSFMFTTHPVKAPPRTIARNRNYLLLEGLRRFDEQQRNRGARRCTPHVSQTDAEGDTQLANELLFLLSRAERSVARLKTEKVRKRPVSVLRSMANLVNQVVSFAEAMPQAELESSSLAKAIDRIAGAYPDIRYAEVPNHRLSLQAAIILYRSWSDDPDKRRRTFRRICWGLVAALEWYLSFFGSCFGCSELADDWQETHTVFTLELKAALKAIDF